MSFLPLLVILIVVFVGLVLILRYVMGRSMVDATSHLQAMGDEYSRRQDELQRRLQESERQYQETIAKARTEAERLLAEARQEAESNRSRQIDQARSESERIVQQALDSRDGLKKELERELETRATRRACELVERSLSPELRAVIQTRWLGELFEDGLRHLGERLKGVESTEEMRVVSAFPLAKDQREALRARVKEALGREIPVTEEVDPKLVAGLVITVGSLVLDGSLANKIQQAMRTFQEGGGG